MAPPDDLQLTAERMADLAALADGSLPESRRAEVEALVAGSPALADALAEQRRAVTLLREVLDDRASARLRADVAARYAGRHRRTIAAPRRPTLAGRAWASAAAIAAVAAVVVAVVVSVGSGASPTVAQAAALATRGATAAAPRADPAAPGTRLAQAVQDVYFPDWSNSLGWRATGQRVDTLGDHRAVTVYYSRGWAPVAYTILSTPAIAEPSGSTVTVAGTRLRVLALAGRSVVTWRRDGHTCVLSGRGVPVHALEQLASWRSGARL